MQRLSILLKAQTTGAINSLIQFSIKAERNTFSQKKAIYGDLFPDRLLNKKQKAPHALYLAHPDGADLIFDALKPHILNSKCDTLMEFNPGIGLLTQRLLQIEKKLSNMILMESTQHFLNHLNELYSDHLHIQHGDLLNTWKLIFQDKQDNGTRVNELFEKLPRKANSEDPNVIIIGAVGTYNFFKHLIYSLVFQNGLMSFGLPEMYILMPPPIFIHLTCGNEVGYMLYRATSVLFQMMFEYRFICKIPREYFLPDMADVKQTKRMVHISAVNPEFLYLVKIEPRRNLFDLCPAEDFPALWYFTKQNYVSRCNRVIPNLEKWIPGCGPRLILNTTPTEPIRNLFPDEDVDKLPKYSKPCTTISCRDFYPNINIFTQFGDLRGSQILTLFTQFRNWPEYSQSSFLASYENTFLKMEVIPDENYDGTNIAEEDDTTNSVIQKIITEEDHKKKV